MHAGTEAGAEVNVKTVAVCSKASKQWGQTRSRKKGRMRTSSLQRGVLAQPVSPAADAAPQDSPHSPQRPAAAAASAQSVPASSACSIHLLHAVLPLRQSVICCFAAVQTAAGSVCGQAVHLLLGAVGLLPTCGKLQLQISCGSFSCSCLLCQSGFVENFLLSFFALQLFHMHVLGLHNQSTSCPSSWSPQSFLLWI